MRNINAFPMKNRLERIEQELNSTLPSCSNEEWLERVAGGPVAEGDRTTYTRFCEPAKDLLSRGGKRWRPLLMVLSAELFGGAAAAEPVYALTPLVELPHTGSLIIDDIEDSSDWRRGAPAVHKKYGTDISINAGNLLYFLPTYTIERAELSVETKYILYTVYAKYMRRVHLGQGLDIMWHRDKALIPRVTEYIQMCRFKTGCLAGMSAELGARAAGGDPQKALAFAALAEEIGVGFQIKDDCLNLRKGNPGKQRGDDIVEGKKSLPVILHLQECPQDASRLQELFSLAAKKGIAGAGAEIEACLTLFERSGALEKAEARAAGLLQQAVDRLVSEYPPGEARELLAAMIAGFIAS